MVEKWVVGALISRDFGGSWNPVCRLLETDITAPVSLGVMIFNIIYIMRRYDMFMWVTIPKNYPGSAATLPTLRDSF